MPLFEFGAVDSPHSLNAGDKLFQGQSKLSTDGRLKLIMQPDGNLVLYFVDTGNPLWSSSTSSGYYATLQTDGNFVVYDQSNRPLWSSGVPSGGVSGAYLSLQSDGNMVLYRPNNTPYWDAKTSIAPAAPYIPASAPSISPSAPTISTSSSTTTNTTTTNTPTESTESSFPKWLIPVGALGALFIFMKFRKK